MAATVESVAVATVSGASSITVSVPAGSGDLLAAVISIGSLATLTLHSSWTDSGLGTLATSGPGVSLAVWLREVSSEPADYTFVVSANTNIVAGIARISGADLSSGLAGVQSGDPQSTVQSTDTDTPTCPSMTTADDNALVLLTESSDATAGDPTYITDDTGFPSSSTGIYRRKADGASTANRVNGGLATKVQASAGSTDPNAWGTLPAADRWICATLAIKSAAAAGGGGGAPSGLSLLGVGT